MRQKWKNKNCSGSISEPRYSECWTECGEDGASRTGRQSRPKRMFTYTLREDIKATGIPKLDTWDIFSSQSFLLHSIRCPACECSGRSVIGLRIYQKKSSACCAVEQMVGLRQGGRFMIRKVVGRSIYPSGVKHNIRSRRWEQKKCRRLQNAPQ